MLDSDMASEMILADILNKEHSVSGLTHSWYYSTELRFLQMQWFYRIGLLLFPHNWHMARVISMMLAIALLGFGVWLLFFATGLRDYGVWAAAFCFFPGGGWYFFQTLYGGYYLPYILISLFTISLILLLIKEIKLKKKVFYTIMILFLGLASGLNGVKQLMVFYVPLIISALCILLFEIHTNSERKKLGWDIVREKCFLYFLFCVSTSLFSGLGYLINSRILSKMYVFKSYDEYKIQEDSFFGFLKKYIWSFGYADDKVLLSVQGIASMCGVIFGLIVMFSGIRLLSRYRQLSFEEKCITTAAVASIIFNAFIFSYVDGKIQYFQPIVPMGIILVVLEIKTENFILEKSRFISVNLAIVLLLIASVGTIINENDDPIHEYRAEPELYNTVSSLKELGYTQGISTFWTANILTELSDGEINMWTLTAKQSMEFRSWLQRRDHISNPPKGRFFLIIKLSEGSPEEYMYLEKHKDLELFYMDDNYAIYGN